MAGKPFNMVVGDKGKKSKAIGTLWFNPESKAQLSGIISVDKLKAAIADGTITVSKEEKNKRFVGDQVIRIAGFDATIPYSAKKKEDEAPAKGGSW